jgi:oligopeptidase A
MGQNEGLQRAYATVAKSEEYQTLSQSQRRVIEHALRDFHLAGVDLDAAAKKQFKDIQQKLAKLQSQFEENVLDSTHAWKKHITDRQLLSGLPATALALAAQNAERDGLDGWVLTLEFPSYMPVMQYADNAGLRKEMYVAYVTRASDGGSLPTCSGLTVTRIIRWPGKWRKLPMKS